MNENIDRNWIGGSEDEIYRENILDHFKNPHNFGKLKNCDINSKEFNPTCGDEVEIFAKINDDKISDVRFFGKGCAISQASASMLTDKIKNMPIEEINKLTKEDIISMLGIDLGVVRQRCGLLCLKTLHKGLENLGERK